MPSEFLKIVTNFLTFLPLNGGAYVPFLEPGWAFRIAFVKQNVAEIITHDFQDEIRKRQDFLLASLGTFAQGTISYYIKKSRYPRPSCGRTERGRDTETETQRDLKSPGVPAPNYLNLTSPGARTFQDDTSLGHHLMTVS